MMVRRGSGGFGSQSASRKASGAKWYSQRRDDGFGMGGRRTMEAASSMRLRQQQREVI